MKYIDYVLSFLTANPPISYVIIVVGLVLLVLVIANALARDRVKKLASSLEEPLTDLGNLQLDFDILAASLDSLEMCMAEGLKKVKLNLEEKEKTFDDRFVKEVAVLRDETQESLNTFIDFVNTEIKKINEKVGTPQSTSVVDGIAEIKEMLRAITNGLSAFEDKLDKRLIELDKTLYMKSPISKLTL